MASGPLVYFAGVGTVVAALGVGFGGAVMLTNSTPVHKEPAAAFAKRDLPVQPPVAEAPVPTATIAPISPIPKKIEEVSALQFAPPSPPPGLPVPRPTIAPDGPSIAAAAPKPATPRAYSPPPGARTNSSPPAPTVRAAPRGREIRPIPNPERRGPVQLAERGKRIVEFDTEDGYGRMSYAQPERRREGFFGFFGD